MRKLPYWVNGGILLVFIIGVYCTLVFFLEPCHPGDCFIEPWMIPLYPAFPIYAALGILFEPLGVFGYILASVIFYFLIGSIFGKIYGKLKVRNY